MKNDYLHIYWEQSPKKDDSALIANAILKGKVMSDKDYASLVTISVDMTGI